MRMSRKRSAEWLASKKPSTCNSGGVENGETGGWQEESAWGFHGTKGNVSRASRSSWQRRHCSSENMAPPRTNWYAVRKNPFRTSVEATNERAAASCMHMSSNEGRRMGAAPSIGESERMGVADGSKKCNG